MRVVKLRKPIQNDIPTYEFHIAKQIRKKYQVDDSLFSQSGNVVFANFYQVRVLADKMNKLRNVENHISPGELNAVGLLDEIYHLIINKYFHESMPGVFTEVINNLQASLGKSNLDDLLLGLKLHMNGTDDKRSTKKYKETITLNLIENYFRGLK